MGIPWPGGYPAARGARRWVSDVLLTAVAAASAIPDLYPENHRRPGAWVTVVLLLIVAPLLVRRVWPVPVFAWVLAGSVAMGLWQHVVLAFAVLIALYTVASRRPRRDALACAGLLGAIAVTGSAMFAHSYWWFYALLASGIIAAPLGLGLYIATRRAYLAELHDRADRLERERDQQVALAGAAERTRIAREMHDIVAHHLTVMTTLAEAAVASSATSPDRATDVMRSVADTGRRALADTRRLLGVLRQQPGRDIEEELAPVPDLGQLDALIEKVSSAGLDTTLEIRGDASEVPDGVQATVYRLVQEALTNTLKHGGTGAHATVALRYLPGELRVDINDDGAGAAAGTAAGALAGTGSGLPGMRERARAYGGDVRAGPRESGGWSVSARLPLDGEGSS